MIIFDISSMSVIDWLSEPFLLPWWGGVWFEHDLDDMPESYNAWCLWRWSDKSLQPFVDQHHQSPHEFVSQ